MGIININIDADGLVYTCGFAAEKREYVVLHEDFPAFKKKADANKYCALHNLIPFDHHIDVVVSPDPISHALRTVKKTVESIENEVIKAFKAENPHIPITAHRYLYLSGEKNYRRVVDKEYKANRISGPKPFHYQNIRDYLVQHHGAEIVDGIEADDKLAMEQVKQQLSVPILVSQDKDLNTVHGWHFNPNPAKRVLYMVTILDAITWFYCQLLLGDVVDNIKGIKGYGKWRVYNTFKDAYEIFTPVGAPNADVFWKYENVLYHKVLDIYTKTYGDEGKDKLFLNAQLLHMLRKDEEYWLPPTKRDYAYL